MASPRWRSAKPARASGWYNIHTQTRTRTESERGDSLSLSLTHTHARTHTHTHTHTHTRTYARTHAHTHTHWQIIVCLTIVCGRRVQCQMTFYNCMYQESGASIGHERFLKAIKLAKVGAEPKPSQKPT